eukprot:TRINITY_DN13890_c1_g1_i5.p1 TRINITY_DN13890_c1_g1~~TRINITY_DN13890_c1_g1_i5.p1  ORF type:complete len:798 (+),score=71.59 TRINITY_DN13890_c1_g1_i5:41-2395(+)
MSPWIMLLVACMACLKVLGQATGALEGSRNCTDLVSDVSGMEIALGMIWRKMVEPGTEVRLPAWVSALAACASEQLDGTDEEHMRELENQWTRYAINATSSELPPNCTDRADFRDAWGSACDMWRGSTCEYLNQWLSLRDMQEVRTNCRKSCGLCSSGLGTEVGMVIEPGDPLQLQHFYQQFVLVLALAYLLCVFITVAVIAVSYGRPLLNAVLSVRLIFTKLLRDSDSGGNSLSPSLRKFVEQRKQAKRQRIARLGSTISCLISLRYFYWLASINDHCMRKPLVHFLAALAQCVCLSLLLVFLWPEQVAGRFRSVIAPICANVGLVISFVDFTPHEHLFLRADNFIVISCTRLWACLLLRHGLAVLFLMLQVVVLFGSYIATYGWQPGYVDLSSACGDFHSEQELLKMMTDTVEPNTSPWTLLFTQCVLFVGCLLCHKAVDEILEWQARAEAHNTAMAAERSAFASVLSAMCDCFVHLDSELNIIAPTPKLAALLLRSESSLQGRSIKDLLATAEDFSTMQRAMLKLSDSQDAASTSHVLHVRMRDSTGTLVKTQIFWCNFQDLNGESCYLIGISESEERTIAPASTHIDGMGPSPSRRCIWETVPEHSSVSGSDISWSLGDVLPEISEASDEPAAVVVISAIEPFTVRDTHGGLVMFSARLSSRRMYPHFLQWFKNRQEGEQFAVFLQHWVNVVLKEDSDILRQESQEASSARVVHFSKARLKPSKHLKSQTFSIDVALPRAQARNFDEREYEVRLQLRRAQPKSSVSHHDSVPPRKIGTSL